MGHPADYATGVEAGKPAGAHQQKDRAALATEAVRTCEDLLNSCNFQLALMNSEWPLKSLQEKHPCSDLSGPSAGSDAGFLFAESKNELSKHPRYEWLSVRDNSKRPELLAHHSRRGQDSP